MNHHSLAFRRRAFAAALLLGASTLTAADCATPRLAIVSPADLSQAPASGDVPIQIDLGAPLGVGGSVSANLVRGVDGAPKSILPVPLNVAGSSASAKLVAANLLPGRSSLFVSVDRDGDGKSDATVTATFSWEPAIDVTNADRCDWLDSSKCLFPFPNDHFTAPDPNTDTGLRVNFALASTPANAPGTHIDPTEWNRNDGFSPGAMMITRVDGIDLAQSGATPTTKVARSLEADTPVVLIDAESGERQLSFVEQDPVDPAVVIIRVGKNLQNGRRYIIALRRLKDATGAILPAGRAFQVYRDRIPTFLPAVEARRPKLEAILGELARAGIGREDLYLAWDFTVQSERDVSERMITMRDDAFANLGAAAPGFTITTNETFMGEGHTFRRVRGTFTVPLYLNMRGAPGPGSRLLQGPDGLPVSDPAGFEKPPEFQCTIPAGATAATPARIAIYGHGLLGDEGEVGARNIRDFTTAHNFVYCATKWVGMSEDDLLTVITIISELSGFPTLADRLHQGFLNFLFLGRAMKHAQGLASNPAFQDANGQPIIDTSELFYDGNSQGGIFGGGLAVYAQDYTRAVLGVTGMNYSTLLRRSVDFDPFFTFMNSAYPDPTNIPLLLALIQMLWDRTDASGGAAHITSDTYPNTPPKKLLMHIAFGDHQVANLTAEIEARTTGARIHQPALAPGRHADEQIPGDPTNKAYYGIEPIPAGAWDGSAIIIWDSGTPTPPSTITPPRAGRDPHETPRRDADAQLQKSEFLKTNGAVIDVCAGAPCTAVDP
jgi:hypothetical protein